MLKRSFYSNGKLLLTGEYAVLDGATALAIPTSYGQSLVVVTNETDELIWKSLNHKNETWFEASISMDKQGLRLKQSTNDTIANTLIKILSEAIKLNPEFLADTSGYAVTTQLDFPRDWGLGSSSTLINNIAQWAFVDAFDLLAKSFGGSGYDIAAAQSHKPIFYTKSNPPTVREVHLPWEFKDQLFFVHLNKKQDSKDGIKRYREVSVSDKTLQKISVVTAKLLLCYELEPFQKIMESHERLISEIIKVPTIKAQLFVDYPNLIKSLGAWGGDFILAVGDETDQEYFRKKGYRTIIPFNEMIKK